MHSYTCFPVDPYLVGEIRLAVAAPERAWIATVRHHAFYEQVVAAIADVAVQSRVLLVDRFDDALRHVAIDGFKSCLTKTLAWLREQHVEYQLDFTLHSVTPYCGLMRTTSAAPSATSPPTAVSDHLKIGTPRDLAGGS